MRWLLLIFVLLAPSLADAACGGSSPNLTVAAAGGNTDLDDCVTASVDGDTITLPAGTFTWTGAVTITNKSITVTGAGAGTEAQCDVGGQTTYTCISRGAPLLSITTKATGNTPVGFFSLKNMTLETSAGATGCSTYGTAGTTLGGTSANVRITGVRFVHSSGCGGLIISGYVRGVMDHSYVVGHNAFTHGLLVRHHSWEGVGVYGDRSWGTADSIGGLDNFFIEDTQFDCDAAGQSCFSTDHFLGARYVMRFNTGNDALFGNHGTESGGRQRSARHFELYRNDFTLTISNMGSMMHSRGGTGRVFDNDVSTPVRTLTRVMDFNSYRGAPGQPQVSYYTWAYCGQQSVTLTRSGTTATATTSSEHGVHVNGSYINISGAADSNFNGTAKIGTRVSSTQFTYTVANTGSTSDSGTKEATYDGNTDATGYPCIDQIGRSTGTYLTGEGPSDGDTMSPKSPLSQALNPLYCFNNTDDSVVSSCQPSASGDVIDENRDYYNTNGSFTGATGIGRGARASRPATCTTGVAYWSTDGGGNWNTSTTETYSSTPGEDGGLDICTATNTWTNDAYVPYTYPHPLTLTVAAPSSFRMSGGGQLSGGARLQ